MAGLFDFLFVPRSFLDVTHSKNIKKSYIKIFGLVTYGWFRESATSAAEIDLNFMCFSMFTPHSLERSHTQRSTFKLVHSEFFTTSTPTTNFVVLRSGHNVTAPMSYELSFSYKLSFYYFKFSVVACLFSSVLLFLCSTKVGRVFTLFLELE